MEQSTWSNELQAATRTALANPPVALGACICLKNIDGRFGGMRVDDLLVYRWVVAERTGEIRQYESIAALLAHGWAID